MLFNTIPMNYNKHGICCQIPCFLFRAEKAAGSSGILSASSLLFHILEGFLMFSTVTSGAVSGIQSYLLHVETDISSGLPSFHMVGSVGRQIMEAGERVRVSLKNAGIYLPPSRITVSLSPSEIEKRGIVVDLPVAAGILVCMRILPQECFDGVFVAGELGLDGQIKPVRGVLPMVEEARVQGMKLCVLPAANLSEGALVHGIRCAGVSTLRQFIDYMKAGEDEKIRIAPYGETSQRLTSANDTREESDFSDVRGQDGVKRVLEIAAAGFHNVLMTGAPGSGKSMLASRLPGILPPMTRQESLEVTRIYSIAGKLPGNTPLITRRPFLSPHHTVTARALTGGGMPAMPGIITLAHRGVLFLDELAEFEPSVLNVLRQPMEEHSIVLSRGGYTCRFPSRFLSVFAMNPCPCGYYPDLNRCSCTAPEIERYRHRVPGPVMNRMDLNVDVPRVPLAVLMQREENNTSAQIRARVMEAVRIQKERFAGTPFTFNADMNAKAVEVYCPLGRSERLFVRDIFEAMNLTARSYHKILKVARTIADLEGQENISEEHLAEAAGYRPRDPEEFHKNSGKEQSV